MLSSLSVHSSSSSSVKYTSRAVGFTDLRHGHGVIVDTVLRRRRRRRSGAALLRIGWKGARLLRVHARAFPWQPAHRSRDATAHARNSSTTTPAGKMGEINVLDLFWFEATALAFSFKLVLFPDRLFTGQIIHVTACGVTGLPLADHPLVEPGKNQNDSFGLKVHCRHIQMEKQLHSNMLWETRSCQSFAQHTFLNKLSSFSEPFLNGQDLTKKTWVETTTLTGVKSNELHVALNTEYRNHCKDTFWVIKS